MEVRLATEKAPGRIANEDAVFAVNGLVGVLDGVTSPAGLDTGCLHSPAWYVQRLVGRLASTHAAAPDAPLPDILALAIEAVASEHAATCDLQHLGTPASTVTLLRVNDASVDYLVLCDSTLVLDRGGELDVVVDDRFANAVADLRQLAFAGSPTIGSPSQQERLRHITTLRQQRANKPDGYWVAAADPAAAHHAIGGSAPLSGPDRVRLAALLTDGASDVVDRYQVLDWPGVIDVLVTSGPQELIRMVRTAEYADLDGQHQPRYKRHDDASVALCVLDKEQP